GGRMELLSSATNLPPAAAPQRSPRLSWELLPFPGGNRGIALGRDWLLAAAESLSVPSLSRREMFHCLCVRAAPSQDYRELGRGGFGSRPLWRRSDRRKSPAPARQSLRPW